MLTKTDFDEIDKRTQKAIREGNKDLSKAMSKAISDNNIKLFNEFLTKQEAKELFVTKDEFNERMDKNFELLDKIYGIVKRADEEQTVIGHNIQKHEIRICKLEIASFSI